MPLVTFNFGTDSRNAATVDKGKPTPQSFGSIYFHIVIGQPLAQQLGFAGEG